MLEFAEAGTRRWKLLSFSPRTIEMAPLPQSVPEGIVNEFREAEVCASAGAFRAALALLRSVLEKTLKANGYTKRHLKDNIDDAAADGMITAARSRKAHSELRDLGNDVLHDKWRVVVEDEVEAAHRYAQRILEDLYDDRPGVEATLREKGRTFAITTSEEK